MKFVDTALLEAVSSPRRREILRLVWREERSAGDIHRAMPDVTFGAISLQLKALEKAGLVDVRPDHKHRFYKAKRQAFGPLAKTLEAMWDDALWRLKLLSELEASRRGPLPASKKSIKRK
jgi:DNA-binding transcriptional ArsR family regulator